MSCPEITIMPINEGCDSSFQRRIRTVLTTNQHGEMRIVKKLFKQYRVTEFRQEEDKRDEVQIHYEDDQQKRFVWILKNTQIY